MSNTIQTKTIMNKMRRVSRIAILSLAAASFAANSSMALADGAVGTPFGPGNSGAGTGASSGDQPECLGQVISFVAATDGGIKADPSTVLPTINGLFLAGAALPEEFIDCSDGPDVLPPPA